MIRAVQQFQLGTVMNSEKQVRRTLHLMKKAGYNGIELCGFMIRPAGFMVKLLTQAAGMPVGGGGKLDWPALIRDSGLAVVSVHEDLGRMEQSPEEILRDLESFGTHTVVLTGMYRFDYGSREEVSRLAERLNAAGERFAGSGVQLLYHNHNAEFRKVGPGITAYSLLQQELDPAYVNFEFDSYWATDAGVNVPALMRDLGPRMKLWHINDRGVRQTGLSMTPILKEDSMELGYGNMDLDTMTGIAKENGIEAVILESHRNWAEKSPIRSFQLSAEYLNRNFGSKS